MIKMMCGMRLVDRVLTDVLCDMVDAVVKIEDVIIQSLLRWYGRVMRRDIDFQIRKLWKLK